MGSRTLNLLLNAIGSIFVWTLASSLQIQAQSPSNLEPEALIQAVERAVIQGKLGDFDAGLLLLEPFLSDPPIEQHARAWYVAGFLHKERFKTSAVDIDRQEAVRGIETALSLDVRGRASWHSSARQALSYLGRTYFNEALEGVNSFQPGDEDAIFKAFEAHVRLAQAVEGPLEATQERTAFHKNIAHAYWQLYEATGEERHYRGLVRQYELATKWSPDDATAWYNLAVHVYNRGVAVMRTLGVETSLGEVMEKQAQSRGFFSEALPAFEQALAFQPGRLPILRGLMTVHHALHNDTERDKYRAELEKSQRP